MPQGEASGGIPGGWARAAVVSAMSEGLAGIRNASTRFQHARIEPRWTASQATEATAVMRYGASDGYAAYRFRHNAAARTITLDATGSGDVFDFHVLLPPGAQASKVEVAGANVPFRNASVEESAYVDFRLDSPLGGQVRATYTVVGSGGEKA